MEISVVLGILCVLFAFWNVTITLIIYDSLKKRGVKVSFPWLRFLAPWQAFHYKNLTKSETGKIGPLFYHWIVSINMALVLAIAAVIVPL